MAVDSLDNHVRMDAEQLTFPLLNQVRRTDHECHLIWTNVIRQNLDRAGGNGDGGCASHGRLTGAHLADQQDAIAPLEALRDRGDDVLLCCIERVLTLQPHAFQEAPDAVHVELVGRRELIVEIGRQ